jgi:uncharacterized protein (DUF1697 family)
MRYVALLRAVNVGKRQVPMKRLGPLIEELGHTEVQTVLQSGNVVFTAPRTKAGELERAIAQALKAEFGFEVPVLVRTGAQLDGVIDANPYAKEAKADPTSVHVAFASGPVKAAKLADVDAERLAPDEFAAGKEELYLHYANGQGRSKMLIGVFEKPLGLDLTSRNWNTVVKLRDLASGG